MTSEVSSEVAPATPAATVVLLRDAAGGLEVLMLRRDSEIAFGGMWVFPGGRVDDGDRRAEDLDDEAPARRAAAREAGEECGLHVAGEALVPFSHWTPPAVTPRRFATWFFLARATDGDVVIDHGEIRDHAWLAPVEVLRRRDAGEVQLAPPTLVTLHDLAEAGDVDAALAEAATRNPVPRYETRWVETGDGMVLMWEGDAGYDSGDPTVPGPRHRLRMAGDAWTLERSDRTA
jgi:8-oxo-dGTP pyrophosphatase MutT (NUDIX family)